MSERVKEVGRQVWIYLKMFASLLYVPNRWWRKRARRINKEHEKALQEHLDRKERAKLFMPVKCKTFGSSHIYWPGTVFIS